MLPVTRVSIIRSSLFALVALVLVAGAPAWATWTFVQVVSFPTGGCADNTTQCTLGLPSGFPPTTAGTTLALGFGIQGQNQGTSMTQVQIISAYTCASSPPCDPANGNVIDTFTTIPINTINHDCGDFIDTHSVDCAYVLAGAGGATYLTINVTNGGGLQGNNRWFPSMIEAMSSAGT